MEIIIVIFIILFVLISIFFVLVQAVSFGEDIFLSLFIDSGFTNFIVENYYAISGGMCFLLAGCYLIYFKPHQAEKYFKQYKANRLSKEQAIEKIAETLYRPASGLPSVSNSKLTEKRIKALHKRVHAEEAFIHDLKNYIRTKET